jgi:hypothetical protein
MLEAFCQGAQVLVLQEHGRHGFQGRVRSVDPGLEVEAGRFKEAVQVGLVFPAQGPAEFLPALPLCFPHLTVR